ncbi:MAG TPA: hypothetical protein VGJ73_22535 [Verrucomicrobiae bacterium]|jgi:hypothetical protein
MNTDPSHYSFSSLLYYDKEPEREVVTSLCYLVGLTNSANHKISDTLPAKRIITWLCEVEEQCLNSKHLEAQEAFFKRYFDAGFYPQTPCMAVEKWSPIEAMLSHKLQPEVLNREPKFLAVATGIWRPQCDIQAVKIDDAKTDEELFWAIIKEVSQLAEERRMWVSIIAMPGWSYDHAVHSLRPWPVEEIVRAGRVVWKRTHQG